MAADDETILMKDILLYPIDGLKIAVSAAKSICLSSFTSYEVLECVDYDDDGKEINKRFSPCVCYGDKFIELTPEENAIFRPNADIVQTFTHNRLKLMLQFNTTIEQAEAAAKAADEAKTKK
jgi:hypothetical protein